jgi:RNA-binding protein 8A
MVEKFDTLECVETAGPFIKSIDGYVLMVSGLNEETSEEDLIDAFGEHGEIKNCVLNLDRRTGYVKGYALLEYNTSAEAKQAIATFNNKQFGGKKIRVDWAFKKTPK